MLTFYILRFSKLPDDKAGQLVFKHILSYVNDLDPLSDDLILNIAFEPIKQQLKRLKAWEVAIRTKNGGGRLGNSVGILTYIQKLLIITDFRRSRRNR